MSKITALCTFSIKPDQGVIEISDNGLHLRRWKTCTNHKLHQIKQIMTVHPAVSKNSVH